MSALNSFLQGVSNGVIALTPERTVANLFTAGEQGAWYDFSRLDLLFQDSAFTVPVTAVEQPIGSFLDRSGRGHQAARLKPPSRTFSPSRPSLQRTTRPESRHKPSARGPVMQISW